MKFTLIYTTAISLSLTGRLSPIMAATYEITDACKHKDRIRFDSFYHKRVYEVGVHATRGIDAAYNEHYKLFSEYLTETAGQRFYPPIEFEVKPYFFEGIFGAIENEELDFLYANPNVYSCIGIEIGATALVTGIKRVEVRGQKYDLDVFGGVIATRADNDEINTIADLRDKIIGAGAIIDLMGGQMQIYEMQKAGLSYVNDPKQMVFTNDQLEVVHGILSGKFDVGFFRTNQIELTLDKKGKLLDSDLFKIIEPKIFVMEDGSLFPFLHSTNIFPEWPFAALKGVPKDVAHEVQNALMDFSGHSEAGYQITRVCKEDQSHGDNYDNQITATDYSTMINSTKEEEWCDERTPEEIISRAPCDATEALADLSWNATQSSNIVAFRTSRSYFDLRTMQQDAGFLLQNQKGEWRCARPSSLYDGITCPEGYFKRSEIEFINGCQHVGLTTCYENDGYDCFCKPCVRAYEVDVYEHDDNEVDAHIAEHYGTDLPGCKKMSICGAVKQGKSITLRIYDNMMRDNAVVRVIVYAGDTERELVVTQIPGTYAYEFTMLDQIKRVNVIDVRFNDEPISQSPIRVDVMETDCDEIFGEHSGRQANTMGECVCSGNSYEMAGNCIDSAYFFLITFSCVTIAMGAFVFVYLGYKKQQNDSVWHINVEELHFNEPPEVIGQGAFGVVVLGQYRGTKVAVKRVIPPHTGVRNQGSTKSAESVTSIEKKKAASTDSFKEDSNDEVDQKKKSKNITQKRKAVKFHKSNNADDDIESVSESKRGSMAMSKEWEKLLHMGTDNVLKILESATSSNHGSGSVQGAYSAGVSASGASRYIPLWLKFDEHSRLKKGFIVEMRMLSRLRHPCITTVMGAVIAPTADPMLVMEYMEYGSLHDLLHNETMTAGGEILLQIVRDIVQGTQFLHASKPPILHGDLKAKNILVDSRFRAKVADFGFSHFKTSKQRNVLQGTPFFMAPEYLRRRTEYNAACDIYSLSMIIYEIYARGDPFEGEDPRKLLPKICHPRINKRPVVPKACPPKMTEIMKKCWSANPFFRPSAKELDYILVELSPMDAEPLGDEKETYMEKVKRKPTSLYDVFPKHIADALNDGKKVEAESHEIVTVVFSDIVGFTNISQTFSPLKVSNMLDRLYQAFDNLANKHNVFKVETIGDAYMGVTNLDGNEFDTHVKQIAEFSQDAIATASQILIDEDNPKRGCVKIRVGFHSGPVVSNVIGSLNPRYGLFGDTVNTASRIESNSSAGKIHCTYASAKLLETQAPEIPVTLRGTIKVKGKGKMKTFWVGVDQPLGSEPLHMPFSDSEADPVAESETVAHDDGNNDDNERNSAHTDDTSGLSMDDSGGEQDHYIKVHSLSNVVNGNQNHRVNMDGSVDDGNDTTNKMRGKRKKIW